MKTILVLAALFATQVHAQGFDARQNINAFSCTLQQRELPKLTCPTSQIIYEADLMFDAEEENKELSRLEKHMSEIVTGCQSSLSALLTEMRGDGTKENIGLLAVIKSGQYPIKDQAELKARVAEIKKSREGIEADIMAGGCGVEFEP